MKFTMHRLFVILLFIFSLYIETIHCKSRYVFSLIDSPIRTNRSSGLISSVSVKEFPILKGLSMRYVSIDSSSIREPHWHANADELGYCLVSHLQRKQFSTFNEFVFLEWFSFNYDIW